MGGGADIRPHVPVLLRQCLRALEPERGGVFVDCTLGAGGHAAALLAELPGDAQLFCVDQDERAHSEAVRSGLAADDRITLLRGNFESLATLLRDQGIDRVDGLLADFGVSSMQLDEPGRGFSFRQDEPLRMVMDQSADEDAGDWLASVEQKELADVIFRYGEERASRRIAAAIVAERPIRSTGQLAEVVCGALRRWPRPGKKHPATQVFQAIRIAVNRELQVIERLLESLPDLMAPHGRAAFISFHSLEHRLVKSWVQLETKDDYGPPMAAHREPIRHRRFDALSRKPVRPDELEIQENPRARSAQLRAVRRLGES
jgi:16S rRNA (cytosine1402-N4)-methyltransferase